MAAITQRGTGEQQMVHCRALGLRDPYTIVPNNALHTARVARARSASNDLAAHIMRAQAVAVQGWQQMDGQGRPRTSSMERRPGASSWAALPKLPQPFLAGSEQLQGFRCGPLCSRPYACSEDKVPCCRPPCMSPTVCWSARFGWYVLYYN